MNLASAFSATASKNLRKPAIFWGDQQFPYEVILKQMRQLAGELRIDRIDFDRSLISVSDSFSHVEFDMVKPDARQCIINP